MERKFVRYVGPYDLHDGSISYFAKQDDIVEVHVKAHKGKLLKVVFTGVKFVKSNQPGGMMLYALTELTEEKPLRCFSFVNWHEDEQEKTFWKLFVKI